jgi:hypothetical protein
MRLQVIFFQEIKSFIIFGTFFRRSKVEKALKSTFDFLKNLLVTSTIRRSKVDYIVFLTFNLLKNNAVTRTIRRLTVENNGFKVFFRLLIS